MNRGLQTTLVWLRRHAFGLAVSLGAVVSGLAFHSMTSLPESETEQLLESQVAVVPAAPPPMAVPAADGSWSTEVRRVIARLANEMDAAARIEAQRQAVASAAKAKSVKTPADHVAGRTGEAGATGAVQVEPSVLNATLVTTPPVNPFPVPQFLANAVAFWKDIYQKYDTDHYLVHDRDSLTVFAVLNLSQVPDDKQRQKLLGAQLSYYAKRVKKLGEKLSDGTPPDKLPADEQVWLAAIKQLDDRDPFTAVSKRLRVQRGQRDHFEDGLRRAGRYMASMRQIFETYSLPEELCYLPHVESSFNDRARSKVGASGLWQFMPNTGKMFMRVDSHIDERNDPFAATEAAAKLLSKNYRYLGTWPLALTAYNHGLAGMMRAVKEVGDSDLEKVIRHYDAESFGFASRNFYSEFLAAKDVAENCEQHFPDLVPEPRLEFDELVLGRTTSLSSLAQTLGVPLNDLVNLNPALQKPIREGRRSLPASYRLRVPKQSPEYWNAKLATGGSGILTDPAKAKQTPAQAGIASSAVADSTSPKKAKAQVAVAESNPANKQVAVAESKRTSKPKSSRTAAAAVKRPRAATARTVSHTVRAGDTLGELARRYGTTVNRIVAQNSLRSAHRLRVGQRLQIPLRS